MKTQIYVQWSTDIEYEKRIYRGGDGELQNKNLFPEARGWSCMVDNRSNPCPQNQTVRTVRVGDGLLRSSGLPNYQIYAYFERKKTHFGPTNPQFHPKPTGSKPAQTPLCECCLTPRASANLELTLFSPYHKLNKNKKNKNNKEKNSHQNLPEGNKLQVLNFAH